MQIIAVKGCETLTIKKSRATPFFLKKMRIKSINPTAGIKAYLMSYKFITANVDMRRENTTA